MVGGAYCELVQGVANPSHGIVSLQHCCCDEQPAISKPFSLTLVRASSLVAVRALPSPPKGVHLAPANESGGWAGIELSVMLIHVRCPFKLAPALHPSQGSSKGGCHVTGFPGLRMALIAIPRPSQKRPVIPSDGRRSGSRGFIATQFSGADLANCILQSTNTREHLVKHFGVQYRPHQYVRLGQGLWAAMTCVNPMILPRVPSPGL